MNNEYEDIEFCPLLSIANKKATECKHNCLWYNIADSASPHDENPEGQCAITEILEKIKFINHKMGF